MERERFIVGIYNYCDYWCPRCAFTRRCRNFSMGDALEREARGEPPPDDTGNAAFWNRLADTLGQAAASGRAAEWDEAVSEDDLLEPDPAWEAREESLQQAVEAHPLTHLARDYRTRVPPWLEAADADLKRVAAEMVEAARGGVGVDALTNEAHDIGEMIEVISWYHTLIPSKLNRALRGMMESGDEDLSDLLAGFRLEDANGSAKVVLIAIDRSMAAWLRLREILPDREDSILGMLALLSRMRRMLRAALPGAESFRRPGFDGEPEEDD